LYLIALNKLTAKHKDYDDEDFSNNIDSDDSIDSIVQSIITDNGEDGKEVPIPRNEVGEERSKSIKETPKEVKEEKKEKEEVEFIPTTKEARDLYGETPKKKKKKKHTYRNASIK